MKNKPQAERATRAQIDMTNMRRQLLGEQSINDHDLPRLADLLVTGTILLVVGVAMHFEVIPWK